ncbi:BCD family chlorophyll transporter-like MFS transporter [Rhodovulum imhoffii]|uniref:BCD family chlorophyll transporter-like MFS transporter n=1 Tax=Rhodovulum imhoffii TaxID=365340 RepID=A0A2T5BSH9_9RHOB|nr:BCD family MFS transporter [Rhodovulum imhoffii]MBK5933475.1 MFS transporter [Rhodovulum imhoffii]PTN02288.1 BCD family chlorophyll transporter-like MFS transporter [Rhodovulum imhoffii]
MTLNWLQIVRLGLVQMCLGAIVVLTTSTLNRLMVVELALPAVLPGMLVALHYGIQISRPSWGFLSDTGGRRTRFIVGGMAVLALGGFAAASGVLVMADHFWPGLFLSVLAYTLIGLGVGASGTSLLALLATATAPERRGAAATITWLMMIAGIAVTAGTVGMFLDPYSPRLLMEIVATVTIGAVILTSLAVWGIERRVIVRREPDEMPFRDGLKEVWGERKARNFTLFVFLSMSAYFMQELILEPYSGLVFGFTPGQSTSLSGAQNGGVFLGMIVVGIGSTGLRIGSLRAWVVAGCFGSAAALLGVAALGIYAPHLPLIPAVVTMGVFNGMFAVAAIGAMMALAGEGREAREGTRMGLWGAAQAIAAGFGGLLGAASADTLRTVMSDAPAFGVVFLAEAILFCLSAWMAIRIMDGKRPTTENAGLVPGE